LGPESSGSAIFDQLLIDDVPIGSNPGSTQNQAPTISDTVDQSVAEDTVAGPISFTVTDLETAPGSLVVAGSSGNTTLLPTANITFGGSGSNRTVTLRPATNQFGTATVTLTVSDGFLSATDSFLLTVTPVNDPPVISAIPDQT